MAELTPTGFAELRRTCYAELGHTFASGITHLVRVGAWAVAPAFAGLLMQGVSLLTPLVVGAGMKVLYDILLYVSFRRLRPPEEAATVRGGSA